MQFGIYKSRQFRMGTPKTRRFASGFERQKGEERKFLKVHAREVPGAGKLFYPEVERH